MTRIGSGGGPPKPLGGTDSKVDVQTRDSSKAGQAGGVDRKMVDSFQRAGQVIDTKLGGAAGLGKLNFSNAELAALAQTFATIVRQNPNADRFKRAKLFAKAILQKKGLTARGGLARLLDENNEEYDERDKRALEEMYDTLAEQLDSTPRFAQLVDDVTESARKIR